MVNVNGLDSKGIAEFQMLLIRANNQQLNGLKVMLESEIVKRQLLAQQGNVVDWLDDLYG